MQYQRVSDKHATQHNAVALDVVGHGAERTVLLPGFEAPRVVRPPAGAVSDTHPTHLCRNFPANPVLSALKFLEKSGG
jgi:hypothetical protein